MSKIVCSELISRQHNDPLTGHFRVNKTKELISRKYYWPSLRKDIKFYVKEYDVCLTSKAVKHKLYSNLWSLLVLTHRWKDLSIDFVTRLPISTEWKDDNYDSILVIIDRLTKMIHYKPVKITINALELAKVIIDVVMQYHSLLNSIISDHGVIFISQFWSLVCYFLGIKRRLSIAFHPQTNGLLE